MLCYDGHVHKIKAMIESSDIGTRPQRGRDAGSRPPQMKGFPSWAAVWRPCRRMLRRLRK